MRRMAVLALWRADVMVRHIQFSCALLESKLSWRLSRAVLPLPFLLLLLLLLRVSWSSACSVSVLPFAVEPRPASAVRSVIYKAALSTTRALYCSKFSNMVDHDDGDVNARAHVHSWTHTALFSLIV